MRFQSTAKEFDADFLKSMFVWVAQSMEFSTRRIRLCTVKQSRRRLGVSGWAYRSSRRISILLPGGASILAGSHKSGRTGRRTPTDLLEEIVYVMAHEIAHLKDYHECGRTNEPSARMQGWEIAEHFSTQRITLLEQWKG